MKSLILTQYAIQGYEVNALDYVLKPVSEFAFCQELDKAVRRLKGRNEKYLTVTQEKGIVRLNLSQISRPRRKAFMEALTDYLGGK